MASQGGIQVVTRVTQILRALKDESQGLSLSQLAERVGLPRSTVHRIVTALAAEGFVAAASPNGRVLLGPEIARLSAARREFWRELRPYMDRLFDQFEETVDCSVLDGDTVRFVEQIPAPHRLRAVSVAGMSFPLHSTANGKAILAELSNEEITRLIPARPKRYTKHTIATRAALIKELDEIRAAGVAFDREEHTIGISAAGVAVRDPAGGFVALTVPMPTQRFVGREGDLAAALTEIRREIISEYGLRAA
jgi:IclR family transcriptional regulator, acetate operon repressor